MRLFPIVALTLCLSFAGPVEAENTTTARFDVRTNGFRFGALEAIYSIQGNRYTVDIRADAQGFLGLLLRSHYQGSSRGILDANGNMISQLFTAHSRRIFKDRLQTVSFRDSLPTKVDIIPESEKTDMSDPVLVTDKRRDPLSFFAEFVQDRNSGCAGPADLYDGRRMVRVTLQQRNTKDGHLRCEGVYRIVKGPDHSIQSGHRTFGLRLDYRFLENKTSRLKWITFTSGRNEVILERLAQ